MRRELRSRHFDVFTLSFLDTICCAFGAVILLFMLSKFGEPQAQEKARTELEGRIAKLQEEREEIRGTSEVLLRELAASRGELTDEQRKIARLRGDLSALRGKFQSSEQEAEVQNKLKGELVAAEQEVTEEMKRLLGAEYRRPSSDAVGGIPVDSEYIIFIIDTSGSMYNYVWRTMIRRMQDTLNIYPTVKGFQVMSDEGGYMFPSYRGKWLRDTPVQRKAVIDKLPTWTPFSNSSPIEGIVEAIRTYYSKDVKISLYVFGDEFTGSSIDGVVKAVDMINREDKTGERRVRIHAIGFPVRPDAPQYTSIRFATLMRILCERNGGTFVGIDKDKGA